MDSAISILGSTGSIGRQSLEVASSLGLKVAALAAGQSVELLERQAREFLPELAVLYDEESAHSLKIRLADTPVKVLSGMDGLIEAARLGSAGTVLTAMTGTVGLRPTLAAIEGGKRIALANKETLVCAGELVMKKAAEHSAEILPVDSEHSAIFQCLAEKPPVDRIKRIYLTASGGPFRGKSFEETAHLTKEDALRHPNWSMGRKITVDSATMMNKGLEFIEAMHLFGLPPEKIEVLVHPQSIVHSMVQYADNSVIAQLGMPDMRLPIQYALTYPERLPSITPELDFCSIGGLTFEKPDLESFRCLALALETARIPGTAAAVMNAANETAVELFLEDKISFGGIYDCVSHTVESMKNIESPDLSTILESDIEARRRTAAYATGECGKV